jgi:ferredoxin like protein
MSSDTSAIPLDPDPPGAPVTAVEIKRRLGTLRTVTDAPERAHITVKPPICAKCPHSFCVNVCPAQCYQRIEGRLVFRYEDCVECGACDVACDQGSVTWTLPRGPYGVKYALG